MCVKHQNQITTDLHSIMNVQKSKIYCDLTFKRHIRLKSKHFFFQPKTGIEIEQAIKMVCIRV